MFTLGHTFVPPAIHAGGLRYHGDAPLLCQLVKDGVIEAEAHPQNRVFEAAVQFARTEGILSAPESAHAIRSAIDRALEAREAGQRRVILFGLSGHGHFDMGAYDAYFAGQLQDYAYPTEAIQEALKQLPPLGAGS
jgi:tryptophan synthase beta chain